MSDIRSRVWLLAAALAVAVPTVAPAAEPPPASVREMVEGTRALRLKAKAHEDAAKWEEALAVWVQAVRLAPADPGVAFGYARCLHQLGRHEEAHGALDAAEHLVKDFKEAKELHSKVLRAWAAIDPYLLQLDRDLKKKPGDADLILKRVRRLKEMRADDMVAADLATVLKADPKNATALWLRGRYAYLDGRYAEALPDLEAAAAAAPNNYIIGREYCNCLGRLKRTADHDRQHERNGQLYKTDTLTAEGWEVLAMSMANLKEYLKAIEYVDRALKLDPTDPWLHYLKGRYIRQMFNRNNLAQAEAPLKEALRLVQKGDRAECRDRSLLGKIYAELGHLYYDLARKDGFQLDVTGKVDVFGLRKKGALLPTAIQYYDQAIELNPHRFYAYENRGLCRFGMGEWALAEKDLRVELLANPDALDQIKRELEWWTDLHKMWRDGNAALQRDLAWWPWFRDNYEWDPKEGKHRWKGAGPNPYP